MSLTQSIKDLQSVAASAMTLFGQLKKAADAKKKATKAQKNRLRRLADRLDTGTRQAARERRAAEIVQLTGIIDAHTAALATPALSAATRQAIRAKRTAKVARRGRLRAQAGTDFSGMLTQREIDDLLAAVSAARRAVARKKRAAGFLKAAIDIAQNALQIAGKLMM
ncbi:MAG: hypothetical protein ACE5OQ_05080 [Woeseia sp.]